MSRMLVVRFAVCLLTCFIAMSLNSAEAFAQGQRLGYTIKYQDFWPVTNEIKFVRVVIKPVAATSADDLDFFVVATNSGYESGSVISTRIEMRKGDKEAVGELYIPASTGYNLAIHTEIDGNLEDNRGDFARRSYYDYSGNQAQSVNSRPSFILASSDVIADEGVTFTAMSRTVSPSLQSRTTVATTPEFTALEDLEDWYLGTANNFGGGRTFMALNGFTSPLVGAMSLESLPSRWFGYEGLQLVMITHDDLKLLSTKHPGKLLAIERWVAASGKLVVLNCGSSNLEKADETMRLLGDSDANARENRRCQYFATQPGADEMKLFKNQAAIDAGSVNYSPFTQTIEDDSFEMELVKIKKLIKSSTLKKAIETGLGHDMLAIDFELGQVICLSDKASFWGRTKADDDLWAPFCVFLGAAKGATNDHRILNADTLRSIGFPEFDEPPRYVFEFSILLYLLAVGPLTFFVLKRKHKLNLMFIVVPVLSTMFCTGILAYAIFAEGFDTRVNLFTFTELNQTTGRRSTSALAHVYSGMTPAAYRFEGSTYGIVNLPQGGRTQRISWDRSSEEVSGGEVRARTNHQVSSRFSGESAEKLTFSVAGENASATATVHNGFDCSIKAVAFLTDDCEKDEVWLCQEVAPGESKVAQKMDSLSAAKAIRLAVQDNAPTTVLASGKSTRQRTNVNRRYYYGSSIPNVETSAVARRVGNCWTMSERTLMRLLKSENQKRYVAVTDSCESYKMPIANAKLESEIHVVVGVHK